MRIFRFFVSCVTALTIFLYRQLIQQHPLYQTHFHKLCRLKQTATLQLSTALDCITLKQDQVH